ncbi:hypothetical protein Csa_000968 [Cucumis sativus]|uniref:Uncharacterized protein n=1 Tax=Cucumis sativus TaxID=3659 RepID=A0A0A0LCR7_CUCSA|nr:hypothetical protein Csa_000968 [Cucumis sativus]
MPPSLICFRRLPSAGAACCPEKKNKWETSQEPFVGTESAGVGRARTVRLFVIELGRLRIAGDGGFAVRSLELEERWDG